MILHDFNSCDLVHLLIRDFEMIMRRGIPSENARDHRVVYVPSDAGVVTVEAADVTWKTAAPVVVLQQSRTDARITVEGSPDNIYTLETIALSENSCPPSEHPPGIFLSNNLGLYTRENRFFTAGGQRRESGWYLHSIKGRPRSIPTVIGVSDAEWQSGVRDGEVVHYHKKSIEPLVVLEGAATMLVRIDGMDYSLRQTAGQLYVPESGEVHGILQVEASSQGRYRHMCAQAPSMFHDPNDRVVIKADGYSNGKTNEYVTSFGIPSAFQP